MALQLDADRQAGQVFRGMIQLVYISAARRLFTPEDIADILEVSRRNNARNRITGLLVYKSGSVIQFLEGEAEPIHALFATIQRDPRHHRITKIYEREIGRRDFADWTMGFQESDAVFDRKPPGYSAILEPDFQWTTLESVRVSSMLREFVTAIR